MKIRFVKNPYLRRILKEIVLLVALSLFSTLVITVAIGYENIYPSSLVVLNGIFFGMFFVGALFFGVSGVVQSVFSVSRHILRREDLNANPIFEKILFLMFFSIELVVAVFFFVSVVWFFPDVIDLRSFFNSVVKEM